MPETVSDTGPILHLDEIGFLSALTTTAPIILPDLVLAELETRGIGLDRLRDHGVASTVSTVPPSEWKEIVRALAPQIQPADAQVFVLVRSSQFQALALTDDQALRQLLEGHGAQVAGTVGVLVRAYTSGRISRAELDAAIEALFNDSSLHLSRAFRSYLKSLLSSLP